MDIMKTRGMARKNLMIIDFLNLCFRYKHQNRVNFAADVMQTISSLGKSYEAKHIIITGDWGSAWRKNLDPEYKANRTAMREKQTEAEAESFKIFLDEVNRAMGMLEELYPTFKIKGAEADDIAAYIALEYGDNYEHTWLISSDKDWDLLISPSISRFSYVTRKEITWENWSTHYDYPQDWHISVKVLQGDSGDNVAGVAGIGPKRAVSLIHTYGSAYDILDQLPLPGANVYIKNLNEFGDKILLNYELMDLPSYCADAIGSEGIDEIIEGMKDVN